ncbi:MAG TPA: hypothetical protein VF944_04535 [Candidatus Bathyarchaeia archaeon]
MERKQVKPPPPTFVIELTRTEARTLEMVLNTVDSRLSRFAQRLRNDLNLLIQESQAQERQ